MIHYLDASALVKRYVREPGSERVARWLVAGEPSTSRLSEIEVASALARRCGEGGFDAAERDRALSALDRHLGAMSVVEIAPAIAALARALLQQHPLRAADAIQLASCLHLREAVGGGILFAAFDERLKRAAEAEGLTPAR